MTDTTTELVARLRTTYSHRGDGLATQLVNPDGPEAAARIEALTAQVGREWQPRIGEEVRASETLVERYSDWRDIPLFVVGISKDRGVDGLNIAVSETWPVHLNSDGYTDGFYIGRAGIPDDLSPLPDPPRSKEEMD